MPPGSSRWPPLSTRTLLAPDAVTRPFAPAGRLPPRTRRLVSLIGIYLVVRAVLVVADVLAAHLGYGGDVSGPLRSWDSGWYLRIAAGGYPSISPVAGGRLTYAAGGFEPVFPMLVRLVSLSGLPGVWAGLTVSLVAGALATALVWRLGCVLEGEEAGWIAAVLFVLFPGMGISWGLMYSECVGLALAAGALYLMLRERWAWAGVVGALATATSPMALPLVLAALVAAIAQLRRGQAPRALLTALLTPVGFFAFAGALGLRYHDPAYWWQLQHQAWGSTVDFGRALVLGLAHPARLSAQGPGWLEWVGVLAVVVACGALARAKLAALASAYCVGVFVLLGAVNALGFKPRLLSWAFPALVAVAARAQRRAWLAVAVGFAMLMPLVFVVYTTLGNSVAQP